MSNFSDLGKILRACLLREQGSSIREISNLTGLSRETISKYTKKINRSEAMKIFHAKKKITKF